MNETASAKDVRPRKWEGHVFFKEGFRPFFLGAGISAVVFLAAWVLILQGQLVVPSSFDPVQWHAHEMIYGTLAAVVAGFLLTAVPNWTGRAPLQGWPLIGLFVLWLSGRVAMFCGETLGSEIAAIVDVSFLIVLWVFIVREIVAGRNWRNLPVAIAAGALAIANIVSHLEHLSLIETDGVGFRLGIGVVAGLIALIGGRIIPSFTGNWLAKQGVDQRPAPFGGFDKVVLLVTIAGLAAWVAMPAHGFSGGLLVVAGVLNAVRIARWKGERTLHEPLVWSLHLGYAWLPVGLLLTGLVPFVETISSSMGLHALTAGAMGGMILAVMTRATLGHTGRDLHADGATTVIYVLGFAAALTRVAAPMVSSLHEPLLVMAGIFWCAAFALFSIRYGAFVLRR